MPADAYGGSAQTFSSVRDSSNDLRPVEPGEKPPYQLHGCHALHLEGEVVRKHYPRWFAYQPEAKIQPPPTELSPEPSS